MRCTKIKVYENDRCVVNAMRDCRNAIPLFFFNKGCINMGFYATDMPVERDVNREHTYEQVWKELVLDKTYTAKDKVVIVDSDALVYRISAMCDTRSILVSRCGKTKEFDTRTKFKEYCKSKNLDYNTFSIDDKIVSEDLSHCLATIKRAIKTLKRI